MICLFNLKNVIAIDEKECIYCVTYAIQNYKQNSVYFCAVQISQFVIQLQIFHNILQDDSSIAVVQAFC